MTQDDFLELFEVLENAIINALAQVDHELVDAHGNLVVMVAVLSKLAADAAIDNGMNEDHFVEGARNTYRIVKPRKIRGKGH